MKPKIHTILIEKTIGSGARSARHVEGTLAELNSYWRKRAKSIAVLKRQVQADYATREACCYDRTLIS